MGKPQEKRSASMAASFAAGGIAGAVDTCITMPLDTIKTQMQINRYPNMVKCGQHVVKTSGVGGLYAGFGPFVLQASGKAAVRFFMFDLLGRGVDSMGVDRTKNQGMWDFACGTGAGVCEALAWTAPTERLKVMRQAAASTGKAAPSAMEVLAKQGVQGLYVGALPTAMRQATSVAVRFTMVGKIKTYFNDNFAEEGEPTPWYVTLAAGASGGAVSVCINNPIDVVKSRVQSGYQGGSVMCAREVMATDGVSGFFRGLSARIPRLAISQAIQFVIVDQIKYSLPL